MVRKRVEYGLLLFAVTLLHIFLVDYLSFFVFAFFLALPAVSLLITIFAGCGVTAVLEIKSASVQKKEALAFRLKVKNSSFMACRVSVKLVIRNELLQEEQTETLFITAGRTGQTVEQVLSSQYCGKLDCCLTELRIYDYLGLFPFRPKTDQRQSRAVFVLPSLYPLTNIDRGSKVLQDAESDVFSPSKAGDDPSELFDIREYRNGDRLSRIHWKLSDRHDRLMVKDFGLPISTAVLLLFDLNGGSKELDGLLDTIHSVSCFLLENQIVHEMEWYDSLHGCFVHTRIAEQGDLNMALNAVLSAGRPQLQPLALTNCSGVYGYDRYSEVIYLCSRIAQDNIALLGERMAGSRIRILLVKEPGSPQEIDSSLAAALGVNLTVIDPQTIGQSLGVLAL
ncbi:MAG TPA: DUF58 domain-containing protein [Desulfosporosinus sp.]|nr:DUF58 domain-containing protein [Desulfosporosinus sp.]